MYRCEATSIAGFIQQLAVSYVRNGYWFYVKGEIPEHKSPHLVDEKLIARYEVGLPRTTVSRRKRSGKANVQYLRFQRTFVLIATKGVHRFFEEEPTFRDIRRNPLRIFGYSIGYRKGADGKHHASVRIDAREWKKYKMRFLENCYQPSARSIGDRFRTLPFEPYAPVRSQILVVYREVNRRRKVAGLEEVPFSSLRMQRKPVKPFEMNLSGGDEWVICPRAKFVRE